MCLCCERGDVDPTERGRGGEGGQDVTIRIEIFNGITEEAFIDSLIRL